MTKRTNEISKPKPFILELERPQPSETYATTLAVIILQLIRSLFGWNPRAVAHA